MADKKGTSRPLIIAYRVTDKAGKVLPSDDVSVEIVVATRSKTAAMQAILENRDATVVEVESVD